MRTENRLLALGAIVLPVLAAAIFILHPFGRKPYNVVLISVDTLRGDHMGYAGHHRPTSPHIDGLAGEGVVFRNAYSQSGWTLPSVATILTGHFPKDHGATAFHLRVNGELPTLASILRDEGYDTRGYVSHVLLTPRYGLDKGFDIFDHSVLDHGDPHVIASGEALTDLALQGLERAREPFFLWTHYFDPHFAYLAHSQWRAFGPSSKGRYDQEIAYTDRQIGRILDYLRQSGLYDRTIIIFTSDHGEEFNDHRGIYHYTCYEEILRVPLIIRAPFLDPGMMDVRAQQIDLLPTILALVSVPLPAGLPGRDLLQPEGRERPHFVERDRPPGWRQRAVIYGGHKLVYIEDVDKSTIPRENRAVASEVRNVTAGIQLFDLMKDPRERENIYTPDNEMAISLRHLVEAYMAGGQMPTEDVGVSEELRERLRSLGYIQ